MDGVRDLVIVPCRFLVGLCFVLCRWGHVVRKAVVSAFDDSSSGRIGYCKVFQDDEGYKILDDEDVWMGDDALHDRLCLSGLSYDYNLCHVISFFRHGLGQDSCLCTFFTTFFHFIYKEYYRRTDYYV